MARKRQKFNPQSGSQSTPGPGRDMAPAQVATRKLDSDTPMDEAAASTVSVPVSRVVIGG